MADIHSNCSAHKNCLVPNTTLYEPTGSIVPHISLYIVQLIAFVSPPFYGRRPVFATLVFLLIIWAQSSPHFTNDLSLAQPFAIAWSYYLSTLEKLIFSQTPGPEADFWRIDQNPKEAVDYASLSYKKFTWACDLLFNSRAIGWNHQVKNVPSPLPYKSRKSFVFSQLLALVYYMLIYDLLTQLGIQFFFTLGPKAQPGIVNSKYLTLSHPQWDWRLLKLWIWGAKFYYMMNFQYAQGAILFVALGLSKPDDWPSLFGSISDVVTVRAFWGKYWHQIIRRVVSIWPSRLVDALGIQRGTSLSSYLQLWIAFITSGTFHALSFLTLPCPDNITVGECTRGIFWFFVSQAMAITFEDFIIWVWRSSKWTSTKRVPALIGYVWVIAWFYLCIPLAGDVFLRMRLDETSVLPFTLWKFGSH